MSIANGTKVGPYEVTASIGAGGMGEVYRARDHRLDRDVAIKILPASFAQDADRLKRFEQEARAVGALNHPNILAIYDIGQHEGAPYLVSELLEGEDLRKHMDGAALPQRTAVEYAAQIAHGLAAAHEKGVVHRDLKPDNIFILRDGRVKILDFGLAKLIRPEAVAGVPNSGPTLGMASAAPATSPGQVMGTVGYMSPEQVRGALADHRSDIFSFGAILYEMLTGQRAFKRDSSIETMTAILKEEPPELTETVRNLSPGLERVVRHCLEKAPERRFQSARDLAFDLESLTQGTGTTTRALVSARVEVNRWRWIALAMAAAMGFLLVFYAGRKTAEKITGTYKQLTFQRGWIGKGRFSPDGESVTFSANWNGQGRRLYIGRAKALNWSANSNEAMDVVSISKDGDTLVMRNARNISGFAAQGVLAMIPATGGTPKDLMDGVESADYFPDGQTFAIVHYVGGQFQLEAPAGKLLYKAPQGWLSDVRISRDGKSIAFFEHPTMGDARGSVALIDIDGRNKRNVTAIYSNLQGSAWHPSGEFWFTGSETGLHQAMFAVSGGGKTRIVERVPGNLTLLDISSAGRVLLSHDTLRRGLMAYSKTEKREVDLAWFDWSNLRAISEDGQFVLIEEEGEGGGPEYTLFLRNVNGDPPTRIGSGLASAISPDLKWVTSAPVNDTTRSILLPIGVGQARELPGKLEHLNARFFSDSKRILWVIRNADGVNQSYVQNIDGGEPQPVTEPGYAGLLLTPDEKRVLVFGPEGKRYLYDLATRDKQELAWQRGDAQLRFLTSGELLVAHREPNRQDQVEVMKVDLKTGMRTPVVTLRTDATGLVGLGPIFFTPDGSGYAYSTLRTYSDLYLVDGLK